MRAAVALVALAACAANLPPREPTPEEWRVARASLAELRATARREPYVVRVALSMSEPRSGRTIDGRGAVAIDPGRAMRMIVVGPGGATALDAWVTPSAWRFAVPALELVRRGAGEARGLPVGFFRWWLLAPLDGDLIAARDGALFLRRDDAVAKVRWDRPGALYHFVAERRAEGELETLDWTAASLAPGAGDRGAYAQRSTGLRVRIAIEGVGDDAPDPQSFVDPDAPGGAR